MIKLLFFLFIIFSSLCGAPRISIITSVYKGGMYIEAFLKDITRQTIFNQCELIIINANSPENEDEIIKLYMKKFSNIRYIKLMRDPGLYGVWNLAISISNAQYLINANLDDKLKFDALEVFAETLDKFKNIDLVYGDIYVTFNANNFLENCDPYLYSNYAVFSREAMIVCLPNSHPMWRRSIHDKYGLFNDSYIVAGDYEMWLRAIDGGAKFLKIDGIYGTWCSNPDGLNNRKNDISKKEFTAILKQYKSLLNRSSYNDNELYNLLIKETLKTFILLKQIDYNPGYTVLEQSNLKR